ncbi:MAG: hypothetical protein QF732_10550, partial [Nitrospinaceae bacterium]|nr:hypothetical protein [Nitrospinaceae bacterium]
TAHCTREICGVEAMVTCSGVTRRFPIPPDFIDNAVTEEAMRIVTIYPKLSDSCPLGGAEC